ncbi:MAG: flagellar biosynthesis anti-sigma factor FlgM [Aquificota bacterium]|jgi:anti-sigma28 factor (negative regulator of flagellin synthesis)
MNINPLRIYGNIVEQNQIEKTRKTKQRENNKTFPKEDIVLDITPEAEKKLEEKRLKEKVQQLKQLIAEGKYVIDKEALANRILDFLG